jgi:hypothetical protein
MRLVHLQHHPENLAQRDLANGVLIAVTATLNTFGTEAFIL